ncbi:MAG: glycoside hydrolase family 5 protein [Gemmatimonadaceae bacterium]|nr:glycoside hydrolase family 5 protein [Chitinophagaceae bacterium]
MRIFFTFFFFVILSFCAEAQPQPLRVNGTQLQNSNGKNVVLRGMSFGWSTFHPRFYTPGAVDWLVKDWKCNVVRAAMGIEPVGGYLKSPEKSEALVRTVVEAAISRGVYVIIDWHSHNIQTKEARMFFERMAKDYGKHPNVIYEIFNEPDYESWAGVKQYSEELIRAIRAIDSDNIILLGHPHWDQDIHLVAQEPLVGFSNIMYTVHYYAATHKQFLRNRCDSALARGIPIFISECAGMEATGDGPLNIAEWEEWIGWAEKRSISWITWSVSDKDESCSVLQKSAGSDGGWKESDLKESGVRVREYLRKYNQ